MPEAELPRAARPECRASAPCLTLAGLVEAAKPEAEEAAPHIQAAAEHTEAAPRTD